MLLVASQLIRELAALPMEILARLKPQSRKRTAPRCDPTA
jgi:hypothetical protein